MWMWARNSFSGLLEESLYNVRFFTFLQPEIRKMTFIHLIERIQTISTLVFPWHFHLFQFVIAFY